MNNSFYNDFAARFAATTLTSLVESFNNQVGNRGFNSMRAAHDRAQWKFSGDKHKSLQCAHIPDRSLWLLLPP